MGFSRCALWVRCVYDPGALWASGWMPGPRTRPGARCANIPHQGFEHTGEQVLLIVLRVALSIRDGSASACGCCEALAEAEAPEWAIGAAQSGWLLRRAAPRGPLRWLRAGAIASV